MRLKLVSHINGDGDLLEAWLKYYQRLGVSSFHLIVHGPRKENEKFFALKQLYPVIVEDSYEGAFDSDEKKRRLNLLLGRMHGQWIFLADSDEFVELPYHGVLTTIRMLELAGANALFAPMLQRLTADGSLDAPEFIEDPFTAFPLCSTDLYQRMGVTASISKYPLFYCTERTELADGGNHNWPKGEPITLSSLLGITHHFKFRRSVPQRLHDRIHSSHPWRHESVQFQKYLETNSYRLPTEGTFTYSRTLMFRKGLLRRFTLGTGFRFLRRLVGGINPRKGGGDL
jgi:hypothetical protein